MAEYTPEIDAFIRTAGLTEKQFAQLAELIKNQRKDLIFACLDQAGLTQAKASKPSYRLKRGGRHCSCGVARAMIQNNVLTHKEGCPE